MDIKNRKVLNILVGALNPEAQTRLVTTRFLDKCDSSTVANFILDCLSSISLDRQHLVCLKSNNAPYMIAAGRILQSLPEVQIGQRVLTIFRRK